MRLSIRQLSRRAVSTAPKRSAAAIQSLNQQVDRYSRYSPSPLSVQQFLDLGQCKFRLIIIFDTSRRFPLLAENNEVKAFEYLRYELPTRLANMLKEMNRLPKELLGLFKITLNIRSLIG